MDLIIKTKFILSIFLEPQRGEFVGLQEKGVKTMGCRENPYTSFSFKVQAFVHPFK